MPRPSMHQADTPNCSEMLNIDQAAGLLNVSRRQVERLISTGRLPGSVKIGGARRIHEPTLRRWIEAGCPKSWQTGRYWNRPAS